MKYSKRFTYIMVLPLMLFLGACTRMSFSPAQSVDQISQAIDIETPVPNSPAKEAPPIVTPPPLPSHPPILPPAMTQSKASCTRGQKIIACLECNFEPEKPVPLPLTKAQKLAKIMGLACSIPNKSYPKNYLPKSPEQIEAELLSCTQDIYPESNVSTAQESTLRSLLDESITTIRQKMYSALWYQPPFSDHFEMYFGLSVYDSVYSICQNQPLTGNLFTSEQALAYQNESTYDIWLSNKAAQRRWNEVQKIRNQLISCLRQKPANLPITSNPVAPEKKCDYQLLEGQFPDGATKYISDLKKAGYKIGVETMNSCQELTGDSLLAEDQKNSVKIAGVRCL